MKQISQPSAFTKKIVLSLAALCMINSVNTPAISFAESASFADTSTGVSRKSKKNKKAKSKKRKKSTKSSKKKKTKKRPNRVRKATDRVSSSAKKIISGLVKTHIDSGKGSCLPRARGSVGSILKRNGVDVYVGRTRKAVLSTRKLKRLKKASDERLKAAAHVVGVIDQIGNGKFKAHKGVTLVFGTNGGQSSRSIGKQVHLNPGSQNRKGLSWTKLHGGTHNRALIAHEIGHYVGRVNKLYGVYRKRVGKCKITGYARRSLGEEFAEVFAAYITNPEFFIGKGRNCDEAFEFFKEQFGEPRLKKTCRSRKRS